jgi:hypothetical protein
MMPVFAPRRPSAAAIHWLQEVLPLVPVTPHIHSASEGLPWNCAANAPACCLSPGTAAFGTRHSSRQAKPASSHTIAAAPRRSASPI